MRNDRPIRFVKLWTSYLDDPALYRLPLAYRAVWLLLHCLSRVSDVPGYFVAGDEPMSLREITEGLHATTEARTVRDALPALMKNGLLAQDIRMGWNIPAWNEPGPNQQASYNRETAEEAKARMKRWRDKKKAEAAMARGQLTLVKRGTDA